MRYEDASVQELLMQRLMQSRHSPLAGELMIGVYLCAYSLDRLVATNEESIYSTSDSGVQYMVVYGRSPIPASYTTVDPPLDYEDRPTWAL